MGTHPSGPAIIAGTNTTLGDWVKGHPEALGNAVIDRFGNDLPYLFKVDLDILSQRYAKITRDLNVSSSCRSCLCRQLYLSSLIQTRS